MRWSEMRFCIERLISEVEARPCIWDSRTPSYSERAKKKAAWEDLCASFVPEYFEAPDAEKHGILATFQKKWKSVRDAFLKELKKTNTSSCSASGLKFTTKQYAYYDNLKFLQPIYEIRPNKNDDDCNNERETNEFENNVDSDHDDEFQSSVSFIENKVHPYQPILKRRRIEDGEDRVFNLLEDHLKRKKEKDVDNDPDRQFLLSLLPDLQSIDPRIKFDLKFEIMQAMKTYKVETLKLNKS